jgi:hypothetical protein
MSEKAAVRPFTFDFADAELDDLRTRVPATHWPDKETVDGYSQGTPLATVQVLCALAGPLFALATHPRGVAAAHPSPVDAAVAHPGGAVAVAHPGKGAWAQYEIEWPRSKPA